MPLLRETDIENWAVALLRDLGYTYRKPEDLLAERGNNTEQVVLTERLRSAVRRLNPSVAEELREEAVRELLRIASPDLLANNETFHRCLTEGITVSHYVDGDERGEKVWIVDFDSPYSNDFLVTNQFAVSENGRLKRPDIALFINGLPMVVFELKNAADENATVQAAFRQIETYKAVIPSLFTYNEIVVISDGLEAKAGSLSAEFSRFVAWRSEDGLTRASQTVSQLQTLINGLLNKATLIDYIRHFIVFEKQKREDSLTKVVSITTEKKIVAYHQYYAVNRAVESTLRAANYHTADKVAESPTSYGLRGGNVAGGDMHIENGSKDTLLEERQRYLSKYENELLDEMRKLKDRLRDFKDEIRSELKIFHEVQLNKDEQIAKILEMSFEEKKALMQTINQLTTK